MSEVFNRVWIRTVRVYNLRSLLLWRSRTDVDRFNFETKTPLKNNVTIIFRTLCPSLHKEGERWCERVNAALLKRQTRTNALCLKYRDTHVASTAPGLTTTSILYLVPVSNLIVRLWPNLVPSVLKNTGPLLGVVLRETPILMSCGRLAMTPRAAAEEESRCEEGGRGKQDEMVNEVSDVTSVVTQHTTNTQHWCSFSSSSP